VSSSAATSPAGDLVSLAELEKRHIFAALEKTNQNRTHAAKLLGISIRTLRNKLTEYGVNAKEESGGETEE
jgi:two-component system response regulator FlrC